MKASILTALLGAFLLTQNAEALSGETWEVDRANNPPSSGFTTALPLLGADGWVYTIGSSSDPYATAFSRGNSVYQNGKILVQGDDHYDLAMDRRVIRAIKFNLLRIYSLSGSLVKEINLATHNRIRCERVPLNINRTNCEATHTSRGGPAEKFVIPLHAVYYKSITAAGRDRLGREYQILNRDDCKLVFRDGVRLADNCYLQVYLTLWDGNFKGIRLVDRSNRVSILSLDGELLAGPYERLHCNPHETTAAAYNGSMQCVGITSTQLRKVIRVVESELQK